MDIWTYGLIESIGSEGRKEEEDGFGATIRIGREIQCLLNMGFFKVLA